jgi:hypothetical protein
MIFSDKMPERSWRINKNILLGDFSFELGVSQIILRGE